MNPVYLIPVSILTKYRAGSVTGLKIAKIYSKCMIFCNFTLVREVNTGL